MELKLEALSDDTLLDRMTHSWVRFQSVHPLQVSKIALWEKWIRR